MVRIFDRLLVGVMIAAALAVISGRAAAQPAAGLVEFLIPNSNVAPAFVSGKL